MKKIKIVSTEEAQLLDQIRKISEFPEYHQTIVECVQTYTEISRIARRCREGYCHAAGA